MNDRFRISRGAAIRRSTSSVADSLGLRDGRRDAFFGGGHPKDPGRVTSNGMSRHH